MQSGLLTVTMLALLAASLLPAAQESNIPAQPYLSDGLVACWRFDDGTGTDNAGTNDATIVGGATFSPSPMGQALNVSSPATYARADGPGLCVNGWTGITVSVWLKPHFYNTYSWLISRGTESGGCGYFIGLSPITRGWFGVDCGTDGLTRASVEFASFGHYADPPVNNWYHIVGTYDGQYVRCYLNGTLDGQADAPLPGGLLFDSVSNKTYIGTLGQLPFRNWSDIYTDGEYDEVRIYNRSLSPAEVRALYDAASLRLSFTVCNARGAAFPANGTTYIDTPGTAITASVPACVVSFPGQYVCTGATVTGNNFNQPALTSVVLSLTNTAILTWNWQASYWVGTPTNGNGTVTGGGWYNPGGLATITATPSSGYVFNCWSDGLATTSRTFAVPVGGTNCTAIFVPCSTAFDLISGLVACWRFNDGTGKDSAGTNDAAIVGGATFTTSPMGQALNVSSPATYARADGPGLCVNGWTGITVSVWLKPHFYNTYSWLISRGTESGGYGYFIGLSPITRGWFGVDCGTDGLTRASVEFASFGHYADPPVNNWYHIVGTYDGQYVRCYLNGALDGQASAPLPGGLLFDSVSNKTYIGTLGQLPFRTWSDIYTDGEYDEVRIYNRSLLPTEVLALYLSATQRVTLVVSGARGAAAPTNGTYAGLSGTSITARVSSPVLCGATQYVCTGATVTGNTFTAASATNITLQLTNNATLTWNWQEQYWVSAVTNGSGTVTGAGWYVSGGSASLTATPAAGWRFAAWEDGSTDVVRTLTATAAVTCAATFAPLPRGTIRFQSAACSVLEYGVVAVLHVDRVGGSYGPATFHYTTSNGTATAGADFNLTPSTLAWNDGEDYTQTIVVLITNDSSVEGNETFVVAIDAVSGASLGEPSASLVTIIDDDCTSTCVPRFSGTPHFGAVATNASANINLEVWNDGNAALHVTSVAAPAGFSATPQDFTVAAGASGTLNVRFAPGEARDYSGLLALACNATGGTTSQTVTGTGVVPVPPAATRTITGLGAILAVTVPTNALCLGVEDQLAPGISPASISDGGTWDAVNRKVKWFWNEPGQVRSRALQYAVGTAGSVVTGTVNFGAANQGTSGDTLFSAETNGPGLLHPADADGNWRIPLDEVSACVARWRGGVGDDKVPVVSRAITIYLDGEAYYYDPAENVEAKRWKPFESLAFGKRTAAVVAALASSTGGAVRTVSSTNVSITVTPATGTAAWALEEQVPSGIEVWAVTQGGTWDATHRAIKWAFFDGSARTLAYAFYGDAGACVPLAGCVSFDGSSNSVSGSGNAAVPLPFAVWTERHGIAGAQADFGAWNASYGQPNGVVYALQANLGTNQPPLAIRLIDGVPVIETPCQDAATLQYVDLLVEGTTNLLNGTWPLSLSPAVDQDGLPANWRRMAAPPTLPGACFRLRVVPR